MLSLKLNKKVGHIINVFSLMMCPIFFTRNHSKDFGGSLEYSDVIKLCGCSRNSYYKYKKAVKESSPVTK